MAFGDVKTQKGLEELNKFLEGASYISGKFTRLPSLSLLFRIIFIER